MPDELNNIMQEQAPAEVAQEQQEAPQQENAKPLEAPKEAAHDDSNWRQIRQRMSEYERENKELRQYVASLNKPAQQEPEEDLDIKDDDLVEGRQVKKYIKSLQKEMKETKKAFAEYNHQSSVHTAEMRLKTQFNDFDSVVNEQNIKKLASTKPVLYKTILANNDLYEKGYAAYEIIKNSGICDENYQAVDKRIEENRAKPRAAASVGAQSSDTPLSRAGDYDRRVLTEERKMQLLRQVEEAKRNR